MGRNPKLHPASRDFKQQENLVLVRHHLAVCKSKDYAPPLSIQLGGKTKEKAGSKSTGSRSLMRNISNAEEFHASRPTPSRREQRKRSVVSVHSGHSAGSQFPLLDPSNGSCRHAIWTALTVTELETRSRSHPSKCNWQRLPSRAIRRLVSDRSSPPYSVRWSRENTWQRLLARENSPCISPTPASSVSLDCN